MDDEVDAAVAVVAAVDVDVVVVVTTVVDDVAVVGNDEFVVAAADAVATVSAVVAGPKVAFAVAFVEYAMFAKQLSGEGKPGRRRRRRASKASGETFSAVVAVAVDAAATKVR